MSGTDSAQLGHWDVCGLSATDPYPRQWISLHTMLRGCWHAIIAGVGNHPPTCLCVEDNTTPISNDGVT